MYIQMPERSFGILVPIHRPARARETFTRLNVPIVSHQPDSCQAMAVV